MILLQNNSPTELEGSGAAYWICLAITATSAAVSLGYSVHAVGTDRANRLGQYAGARSAALMIATVVVAIAHTRSGLVPVAAAMVAVQALDAIIGVSTRKLEKIVGPAVLALVNLAALLLL